MVDTAASGAVLITSGNFTQPAFDFVKDKPIELINGEKLAKLIAEVKNQQQTSISQKNYANSIPREHSTQNKNKDISSNINHSEVSGREKISVESNPVCPYCKKPMVLRVAHRGQNTGSKFWGCVNYPSCKYTISFQ